MTASFTSAYTFMVSKAHSYFQIDRSMTSDLLDFVQVCGGPTASKTSSKPTPGSVHYLSP